jgi:hypothetical protein
MSRRTRQGTGLQKKDMNSTKQPKHPILNLRILLRELLCVLEGRSLVIILQDHQQRAKKRNRAEVTYEAARGRGEVCKNL